MTDDKLVFPRWPQYEQDEIEAVVDVLRSGKVNYWTGDQVKIFEKEYAEYVNVPHSIAVCNGSVALELAMYALDIGSGDDVIVPSKSFVATASSVALRGAKPVFADIDLYSQNITTDTIKKVITKQTRAVIVVHLGGWPCDMDAICQFAKENNIRVIEDCAQAHGAKFKNRPVGSFGDAAAFSFCQDKIISTGGEGGMLLLKDEKAWQRAWSFKDHGKDYHTISNNNQDGYPWPHHTFGTNWRLTEIQAAIGRIQLRKLSDWVSKRSLNAKQLRNGLSSFSALSFPEPSEEIEHAYYRLYGLIDVNQLRPGWSRDRMVREINLKGVPCYAGSCSEIYREKAFIAAGYVPESTHPNASQLSDRSFCFAVHHTIKQIDVDKMIELISEVAKAAFK